MYRPRDTRREALTADIAVDLRRLTIDSEHVGHAFASLHGLGATDLQALIAIMDAEREENPITPGRLGEHLNLSSGSVTALIDRLERAGHIRRDRDTVDRRKVFLRYADRGARVAMDFFRPLGWRTEGVMSGYTDDELTVVHRFMRDMAAMMRQHRDDVRAGRPTGPAPGGDAADRAAPAGRPPD
ncbi:MarR family transcriptional regulator [Polymorphospora sp. NPDC050346]|uniref:MarR family winged helix-turn-helix transcriptional regulator n=1 Tax=Polymorphospora sp. NPDC050346 TaxID=3155780 RepID=UPI0033E6D098